MPEQAPLMMSYCFQGVIKIRDAIKGNLIWDHGKQTFFISRGFMELRDRKRCWDWKSQLSLWNLWISHLPNHTVSILFKSLPHTCIKKIWLSSHDELLSQCLASWIRASVMSNIWVILKQYLLFLYIWNLSFKIFLCLLWLSTKM